MNATGKRLGFALLFTGAAVAFNIYAVLTGSAAKFYEDVTTILLSNNTQVVDTDLESDYRLQEDDCNQFALSLDGPPVTTSVRHLKCTRHNSVGI